MKIFQPLKRAFSFKFSLEELAILAYLHEEVQDGASHSDISSSCGNSPYTMDRYMRRLERKGFVSKRKSETDARVTLRFLTPDGVKTIEEIKAAAASEE